EPLRSRLRCPHLRPAEEKPLLGRKSVYESRRRLALEIVHQRRVGNIQSAEVADILADRPLPLDLKARQHFVVVKLVNNAGGSFLKLCSVLGRPPHIEVAFSIVLAALIVETMRDLMPDDRAHSAVVDRIVSREVKEWRLEDAGRKRNIVIGRRILRIDGR